MFSPIKKYLFVGLLSIVLIYIGVIKYNLFIVEAENMQLKATLSDINKIMEIERFKYEENLEEFNKTYNTPPTIVTKYKTITVKEVVDGTQEDCNEVFRLIDSYTNIDGMLFQN